MTELLGGLLSRLEARDTVQVRAHEPRRWPAGAHDLLVEAGVLVPGPAEHGLVCDGCEEACWVEPEWQTGAAGTPTLVAACTGRSRAVHGGLVFPPERLATWRMDAVGLCAWLAGQLDLRGAVVELVPGWAWSLGAGRFGGTGRLVAFTTALVGPSGAGRAELLRTLLGGRAALVLVPSRPVDLGGIPVVALDRLIECRPDGLVLDRTLLDLHLPASGLGASESSAARRFSARPGTTWAEVRVWLVDGDTVRIVVPGRPPRSFTAAELGLTNPRSRERRRTKGWAILEALSEGHGTCSRHVGGIASYEAFKVQVSLLGRALRAFVGIDASPFHPTSRTDGVRAVFQAGPLPEPELYVGQDRWGA